MPVARPEISTDSSRTTPRSGSSFRTGLSRWKTPSRLRISSGIESFPTTRSIWTMPRVPGGGRTKSRFPSSRRWIASGALAWGHSGIRNHACRPWLGLAARGRSIWNPSGAARSGSSPSRVGWERTKSSAPLATSRLPLWKASASPLAFLGSVSELVAPAGPSNRTSPSGVCRNNVPLTCVIQVTIALGRTRRTLRVERSNASNPSGVATKTSPPTHSKPVTCSDDRPSARAMPSHPPLAVSNRNNPFVEVPRRIRPPTPRIAVG
jgi:hypothetical protein